jgi:hypothetical protein
MKLKVGTVDIPQGGFGGRPREKFWSKIADRVRETDRAISVQIPIHIIPRNFQSNAKKLMALRGLDCRVHLSEDRRFIVIAKKKAGL